MAKPKFYDGADTRDPAVHWQRRAMTASFGGDSLSLTVHTMLCAVLARRTALTLGRRGVSLAPAAEILLDGTVVADCRMHGKFIPKKPLGSVVAVRDSFRYLADHCKMTDVERNALFEELRKWMSKDHRARSEN